MGEKRFLLSLLTIDETENKRVSSFIRVILIASLFLSSILEIVKLIIPPSFGLSDCILLTLIGTISIILIISQKGKALLAGFLFIITLWISFTFMAWIFEGVRDIAIIAYIITIMIAMNINLYREAMVLSGLSIVSVWTLVYSESNQIVFPNADNSFNYSIEYTFILGIIILLLHLNRKNHKFNIRRIKREFEERLNAEVSLRDSETKSRALLDLSFGLMGLLSTDGTVQDINKTALEFAGVQLHDVTGKPFWETPWWSHSPETQNQIREAIMRAAKGELVRGESTHLDKDGELHIIDFTLKPVFNEMGHVLYLIPEGRDITEKSKAEEEIKISLERSLLQQSIIADIAASPEIQNADILELSQQMTELGSRVTEAERVSIWMFNENQDELECIDLFEKSINRHSSGSVLKECEFSNEFEYLKIEKYVDANDPLTDKRTLGYVERYLKPMGITSMLDAVIKGGSRSIGVLCFEYVGKKHIWEQDEISFACQLADQVSLAIVNQEHKKAYESLQKSEEKFRELVENINDMFFTLDTNGIITYISPQVHTMYNYQPDELIGHSFLEIVHPDDMEKVNKAFHENMANRPNPLEFIYNNRNGDIGWARTSARPIIEDGRVTGVRGLFTDITDRKLAEEKISILAHSIQNISECVSITDLTDKIIYINQAFLNTYQYEEDELVGKNISILRPPDYSKAAFEEILSATLGGGWKGEIMNQGKGGREFPIQLSTSVLHDENNEPIAIVGVSSDITEKKEATRRIFDTIIETEERERKRYSHELHDGLGPILSTIKLYFQMLKENMETNQKDIIITKVDSCIDESIQTIKEISYNLSPSVLNNFGIIAGIQNFINRLNETAKLHIDFYSNIEHRFEKNLEITIYRVITELINNTIKYANASNADVSIIYSEKDNSLSLNYLDNGCGFDLDKELKAGKGLGLSNIYQRINTLGGEINIETSLGKGFMVRIEFKKFNQSGQSVCTAPGS